MRVLGWIIGLPLAILAAVFAVANRAPVRLDLWPFPWSVEVAVYLAVLAPLVLGLMAGMLLGGVATLRQRSRAAAERRRAESLTRQLDGARKDLDAARAEIEAAKSPALPPAP